MKRFSFTLRLSSGRTENLVKYTFQNIAINLIYFINFSPKKPFLP
ncbi:hypothetical protein [Moraxella lacunata]